VNDVEKPKQYLIFNKEITLSPGKWRAQSAHIAARFERAVAKGQDIPLFNQGTYDTWLCGAETKISVEASQKQLEKLETEGYICVRDHGTNEVEANTLTAIITPPLFPEDIPKWLKRLQTVKG